MAVVDRDRRPDVGRHRRRHHVANHGAGVLSFGGRPRIWFNETYRGTFQLIGLLREAREVTVIGSHPVASTPYLQACDEVIDEPHAIAERFVEQALEICRRHRVDVFVPGREMGPVSHAEADFAALGVRLQVSPGGSIDMLAKKGTSYRQGARLRVPTPVHEIVEDVEGFRRAYRALREAGHQTCIKPDLDHGGHGFRIIDENAAELASLARPPSVLVAPEVVEELLGSVARFEPLVVSEYLAGTEVSVDCLSSPSGELLMALPRSKGGLEWTREICFNEAAIAIARAMVEGCGLRYLSNVQVKYRQDERSGPVLLEVNTRAASGLYQSCRAAGVNLPAAALAMTLGEKEDLPAPTFGRSMIVYNDAVPYRSR